MKRLKTLLVFVVMCLFLTVASCTGENVNHEHSFAKWNITKDPTLEAEGEAYHICNCNEREEVIVPCLSDAEVWSLTDHVSPTCANEGSDTYVSEYGTVVAVLETVDHQYGEWNINVEPTLTEGGQATRVCVFGDRDQVELPNLLDESVWTCDAYTASTCTVNGEATYSSVYGTVTVSLELAPHPYGEWIIDVEPTLTEGGQAHHVCECGHEEQVDVPALEDEIWSVVAEVAPTYNDKGNKTYESIYGQVVISVAKKVAPYDGKTYSAVGFDAAEAHGPIYCETAWNENAITFDENGVGVASAFPFRGLVSIKMIDENTGEVEFTFQGIEFDENGQPVLDEEGNLILTESVKHERGFVDFATGIIVKPYSSSYDDILVCTPYEVGLTGERAKGASWENTIVVDYTFEEVKHSILVYKNRVYFGVSFVDENGNSLDAEAAYSSNYVYVNNTEGKVVGFVNNGSELVVADGHEGTYEGELGSMVVSGYGVVTVNGVSGYYDIGSENDEYSIAVYVNDSYYEVSLSEGNYVAVKPMVNITYHAGEYAVVESESVNKNVVYTLPNPTAETMLFVGWYYDEACENAVESDFIPTSDVELYASWKVKVIVKLIGVLEGDDAVVILGEGEQIGSRLPEYGIEVDLGMIFRGWYLDAEYQNALPEAAEVTAEDSNISIYAKWETLPAYYGSYKGTEIWNAGYGNSSSKAITIDENGNISGQYTGSVVSYDPETQEISWVKSGSTKTLKMWYDDVTGTLIIDYYNYDYISNDIYIYGKYQESNKLAASYAVKCNISPSSNKNGYYAHFVNIMTQDGAKEIFIYNSRIYSEFTATTTSGEAVIAETVRNFKDVVVRDASGEIIVAVSSIGASFNANNNTITLDKYFGTYANGENQVVLDGTGIITTSDGKSGTYAAVEGQEYGFDVYLNDGSEYYQLTLNGSSYTMVYPEVELTFVVGEGHTPIASQNYNINVPATLPSGEDEGYVFNGWFLDAEFVTPVPATYKPTVDASIYAKYSLPAVLTVVYNNGEADGEFVYSVGDIATLEMPLYAKHAFVNWYTTNDFVEGTEWTNGVAITVDTTIYAKWEVAPVYNNLYVPTEVEYRSEENGLAATYTWTSAKVDINPYGKGECTAFPFRGSIEISDYNSEAGTLLFNVGSSVYRGFIDAASGLLVLNNTSGATADIRSVFVVSPFETKSIASVIQASYWDDGATMCINYPYDGTNYTMFVSKNHVYFNVSFTDADGNAVEAQNCYKSSVLYVKDADGKQLGKYGHDGTTMQELDGYEGTYTNADATMTLDGVKNVVLNGVAGTYSKAAEGASYTFDVYAEGSYYELTVNKETMTYSYNQPFVDITFNAGEYATVEGVHVNKNILIELPTPENASYIFRGWYLDQEYNEAVEMNYIPTETCVLYAKWDEKVSVTVVYGNELEEVVLYYGVGDTPSPVEPEYTNGKLFNGWYSDSELSIEYTLSPLTESIVIYASWVEASPFFGTWAGANIYGSSSNGGTSSGGYSKNLTIDANGQVTGAKSGTITNYDATTGTFTLGSSYGFYDVENGVLVVNYGSNATGINADMYVFVKDATSAVCNGASSYWNKGLSRIAEFTLNDGSKKLVFVHDNKVYGNITFTSSTPNVTANTAYKADDLTVYDANGAVIATFVKSGSCLANPQ